MRELTDKKKITSKNRNYYFVRNKTWKLEDLH